LGRFPAPPSAINRRLSASLDAMIVKALDKDPGHRYQSACELGVDLRRELMATTLPPRQLSRFRSLPVVGIGVVFCLSVLAYVWPAKTARELLRPDDLGRVRLAVLQPRNLTGQPTLDTWAPVAQTLLVSELTGVATLSVMEPLSLNNLIET